jgi:hypothetical protein
MYLFQIQFLSTVSVRCIDYAGLGWLDFVKVVHEMQALNFSTSTYFTL